MREFALLLKFAFLLLSVLLVFFSPRCFSYEFCACILFLYLIENLLYFTCYKEDVVSFHGVFFLSFLFANFIYPVFYYVDNTYVSLFRFEFDESVISYATSVAFCAYNCYLLGVLSVDRKMAFKLKSCNARFVTCSFIDALFYLILLLFFCYTFLYSLISYAEHNGYTYFSTQLGIFSFIPFAQSFIVNVFDVGLHNLTSADFNSYLTFGSVAGELGLGTNMVSDIYLSFGLIGVVVIFYLFGIYLQYCKSNSINSIYCFIAYSVMVSDSVFIVRGSVFEIVKLLIWFSTFEKLRQIVCSYVKK